MASPLSSTHETRNTAFQSVLETFEYSSSTLTGTRYSSSPPVTRAFNPPPPTRSSRMRWRVIGPSFTLSSYHLSSSKGTVLSTDVCADAGGARTVAASRVTIHEVRVITPPFRARIVTALISGVGLARHHDGRSRPPLKPPV